MDSVLSIQALGWKEITDYAGRSQANPDKILRMVRETVRPKSGGKEQSTGVRIKFHAPEILLDFLLGIEAARDGTADCGGSKKAQQEVIARAMRSVRLDAGTMHPPHQRRSDGQQPRQPPETLHDLSLVLACHAETYGKAAIQAHAASIRVNLLRGFGNALVAPVAKSFIEAVMLVR
jgi:hypothetical protein